MEPVNKKACRRAVIQVTITNASQFQDGLPYEQFVACMLERRRALFSATVLQQLSAEINNHNQRAYDFSFNGIILKAPFFQVGPTLMDRVRAQLLRNYEEYEVGNRYMCRFNRQALPFEQQFIDKFGSSWTLRYCADKLFMEFVVLCTLFVSVRVLYA